MATFVHKDPSDRNGFDSHWNKIMNSEDVIIKTITFQNQVVGHIAKFVMFYLVNENNHLFMQEERKLTKL